MKKETNVIGVIPARYASTRLPVKLLRDLCGKSILQWTWESASGARLLDRLIIACDHPEIEKEAKKIGAEVVNTSDQHTSGTDRIAEAVRDIDAKLIINIQADEPLIHPSVIDSLAQEMFTNKDLFMATVKKKIEDKNQINNPNIVKVICDKLDFAIYFSRFPIPYYRSKDNNDSSDKAHYKHLGIYAYSKDFLYTFKNLPVSRLEKAEKLEQLRALEAGYKIKVIETHFDSFGIDTADDLYEVERILMQKGYA
ncbi:MAG: 3-deoxy-manno-octulosonate cytidylyltransferase [Candidatus Omnitrophica bacterium]|nr:3-deoxy-manno-octulosonate cytidylyltransferase [Candidatus Omnitrophota bacterium]MCF7893839.1 3-deoxy-manno-octulosonate cytidylyltransferase [Candidatus Omnitrophota bacterium]